MLSQVRYVWCKKFEFYFLFKIFFYIYSDYFDVLVLKIILKNKKNYFNIFLNKKYFKLLSPDLNPM